LIGGGLELLFEGGVIFGEASRSNLNDVGTMTEAD